ncbi:MAG: hypothetical protein EA397_08265 [Deltaproteobacteria bacterium]|nr:MAG: hypothetical protein EA397_08265 [Deltaproteobacteria bacterium]
MDDREQLVQRWLEAAKARGFEGAEVLHTDIEGFRASVARGKVGGARNYRKEYVSVRVWLEGGREGRATGSVDAFERLLDDAGRLAEGAARWADAGPVGRTAAEGIAPDIADRRYPNLAREDRLEALVSAEKAGLEVDPDLEVSDISYEDARQIRTFANSRGVSMQEPSTWYRLQGAVHDPRTGLGLREVLHDRSFATVASVPFTAALGRRLVELRGDRATLEGPIRAVLSPWATAQLLRLLGPHFRWAALEEGSSFLAKARPGGAFKFSTLLHLVDDGLLSGGLRSRSFDDRGVSPVPLTLIRDGVVEGWFQGVDEARVRGVRPTGHETDGFLHPSNLVIRGGLRSVNALLAEQDVPVLILDHLRGLQEGLDLPTGELDCRASGRVVLPRNQIAGVMPFMRISGSLATVFSSVLDLASDTDRFGGIDAAALLVDGFSVEEQDRA